jgi:hypothetical protein
LGWPQKVVQPLSRKTLRRIIPRGLGLRREAQRHAAFARTNDFLESANPRPPESGVAAPALPPHSKTLRAERYAFRIRVHSSVVEKFTAALVGAIPNFIQNYQCNFSGDAV